LHIKNFDWKSLTFSSEDESKEGKKVSEIQKEGIDTSSQLSKSMNKFKLAINLSERLSDVKGIDEVRNEIEEIVLMLKNPAEYENVGAKLIRGILLIGKPGTGKTLLARALAGESKVNFIYLNASEFDKSLVGAGSKMLKEMFEFAKVNQPCIIFIDEIDTLLHKGRRSG
jgi:ATP-dependent Zn protease